MFIFILYKFLFNNNVRNKTMILTKIVFTIFRKTYENFLLMFLKIVN